MKWMYICVCYLKIFCYRCDPIEHTPCTLIQIKRENRRFRMTERGGTSCQTTCAIASVLALPLRQETNVGYMTDHSVFQMNFCILNHHWYIFSLMAFSASCCPPLRPFSTEASELFFVSKVQSLQRIFILIDFYV